MLFVLLGALQWRWLPRSIDVYYHLSVVEGFRRAGGVTADAFWEYAPVGRPHLYPPVFHLFLALLRAAGLSPIAAGRLADAALPPLVLAAVWRACRHFLTERAAFFATLIWSSVYSLYLSSFIYPANALAFLFGMAALVFFDRRRYAAASVASALALYSHGFMGWFILFSALLYEVLRRGRPGP